VETTELSNWGNYPRIQALMEEAQTIRDVKAHVDSTEASIVRGNGRCYGDSASAPVVLSALGLDKYLHFDDTTGSLTCQAGVLLADVIETFLPRGWFPMISPGTKFITIGGAIAADVHGKNHHAEGSFYHCTDWVELMLGSGEVVRCSRHQHSELFEATFGGMGLTGMILAASFHLKRVESAYISFESERASNLDEIFDAFERSASWTYSMAWIDCLARGKDLGRSILMRGEHAKVADVANRANPLLPKKKLQATMPFYFPDFALNELSIKAFNWQMYHRHGKGTKRFIQDFDSFFYPLDAILRWNRLYGRRGFTQYQFVLPLATSREGLRDILTTISDAGLGSFLAVLKLFGAGRGMLSFPMEGYTLALDFPITPQLFPLLDKLDTKVLQYGGRIYLAKDVRMSKEVFWASYPEAEAFMKVIQSLPKGHRFASLQSERLGLHL
jgi:decaprenylphospho-beta-D-ribofuranose 2-oxidase